MNINEYFRILDLRERAQLAEEIGCSASYLNQLIKPGRCISKKFAEKIPGSEFNLSQPEELQFTHQDLTEYLIFRSKRLKKPYTRRA